MRYIVPAPDFPAEHSPLEVDIPSLWASPVLLYNGLPVLPEPRSQRHRLQDTRGVEHTIVFKSRYFFEPIPDVIVDGSLFRIAPPLPWYQWLWAALPLLLITLGGAIGGIIGSLAAMLNARILRSSDSLPKRLLMSGGVSAAALAGYLILAVALTLGVQTFYRPTTVFTSEPGRFSVTTPYTLEPITQQIVLETGQQAPLIIYAGENQDHGGFVGYLDIPADVPADLDVEPIYESMEQSLLSQFGATDVNSRAVDVAGMPGREVSAQGDAPDGPHIALLMRTCMQGSRIYIVMAMATNKSATTQEMRSFVDSFRLSE